MRTCGKCSRTTRKIGDPILSESGYFLDQVIVCRWCEWAGVDSLTLTKAQADEFRLKPRQLRLNI